MYKNVATQKNSCGFPEVAIYYKLAGFSRSFFIFFIFLFFFYFHEVIKNIKGYNHFKSIIPGALSHSCFLPEFWPQYFIIFSHEVFICNFFNGNLITCIILISQNKVYNFVVSILSY